MKATILLGTLKKQELSNTEVLCEVLCGYLTKNNIESKIIKLINYNILPGTYSNMGGTDTWPTILKEILSSEILIFATPVWWNNQSSEIQKVIERLDELHDEILEGKKSKLEGKIGGIVVTGDSDGAQHIIANLSNFFNAVGILLPPFSTLSVLSDGLRKGKKNTKNSLMKQFEEDFGSTAEKMTKQILKFSKQLRHA